MNLSSNITMDDAKEGTKEAIEKLAAAYKAVLDVMESHRDIPGVNRDKKKIIDAQARIKSLDSDVVSRLASIEHWSTYGRLKNVIRDVESNNEWFVFYIPEAAKYVVVAKCGIADFINNYTLTSIISEVVNVKNAQRLVVKYEYDSIEDINDVVTLWHGFTGTCTKKPSCQVTKQGICNLYIDVYGTKQENDATLLKFKRSLCGAVGHEYHIPNMTPYASQKGYTCYDLNVEALRDGSITLM